MCILREIMSFYNINNLIDLLFFFIFFILVLVVWFRFCEKNLYFVFYKFIKIN